MITIESIRDDAKQAERCCAGNCAECRYEQTASRLCGNCSKMLLYRLKTDIECLLLEAE